MDRSSHSAGASRYADDFPNFSSGSIPSSGLSVMLWLLTGLFLLRVIGQVLVEFWQVRYLPESEEWFSGAVPYPRLLTSQIFILILQIAVNRRFSRGPVTVSRLSRRLLWWFGCTYLGVMLIRYGVRMSLYPLERWTGGAIPIFFHWVLAAWVLAIASGCRTCADKPRSVWGEVPVAVMGGLTGGGLMLWLVYLLAPSLLGMMIGLGPARFAVRRDHAVFSQVAASPPGTVEFYRPRRMTESRAATLICCRSPAWGDHIEAALLARMFAERGIAAVVHAPWVEQVSIRDWLTQQPWFDGTFVRASLPVRFLPESGTALREPGQ